MLLAATQLINTPIMSLQTGGQLAISKRLIIDPRSLKLIAIELDGPTLDQRPSFLRIEDIREISQMGIIVDSADEFVGPQDIIKLKEVLNFNFVIDNIAVKDEKGRKLGKLAGYSMETISFFVKQLSIKRPLLKSLTDVELLIDREQIVNVSNDAIVVKNDSRMPTAAKKADKAYVNPFRNTTPQPETMTINLNDSH